MTHLFSLEAWFLYLDVQMLAVIPGAWLSLTLKWQSGRRLHTSDRLSRRKNPRRSCTEKNNQPTSYTLNHMAAHQQMFLPNWKYWHWCENVPSGQVLFRQCAVEIWCMDTWKSLRKISECFFTLCFTVGQQKLIFVNQSDQSTDQIHY